MNLNQLQQALAKTFPKMWIKHGDQFDSQHAKSLWTGEGSMVDIQLEDGPLELEMFDMYSCMPEQYEFGVHHSLRDFLKQNGYYAEAYDAGTFFIWKV